MSFKFNWHSAVISDNKIDAMSIRWEHISRDKSIVVTAATPPPNKE